MNVMNSPLTLMRQAKPLAPGLRRAMPGASGRAALLLPAHPAFAGARRRRMARALLDDAARGGGGEVYHALNGAALLMATAPTTATRVAETLAGLAGGITGGEPIVSVWHLPADADTLLDWAERQVMAPPEPAPPETLAAIATLAARLDRVSPDAVLRADAVSAADGALRGRWLRLSRARIAAQIAPLGDDADLLAHALERLAAKLLPGLAAWAAKGEGLRFVTLPRLPSPRPVLQPGAIGVVPLAAATDPDYPTFRLGLAERGWQVAFSGIDEAACRRLDLPALPADWFILRWSAALAEPAVTAALAAVAPERIMLTGADAAGRAWAARRGIGLFAGPPA